MAKIEITAVYPQEPQPVARLEIGKTKGGVSLTHIAEPAAFQLPEGMYALYTAPQPSPAVQGDALDAPVDADVQQDAERYRYLRDGVLVDGEVNEDLYVHVDHQSYPNRWALVGLELDEAIDAARATQDGKQICKKDHL